MALQQIVGNQRTISLEIEKPNTNRLRNRTAPSVAPTQPSLQYKPLSILEQEIRLLYLHDGNQVPIEPEGRQVIASSSLVHVSLNDNPKYIALSYPWGSGQERDSILVDGLSQPIGSNLAATILDINARRQGQPVYLWIDRLCINQDDLEDKAWQIHHISKMIYSRASTTLVWLGIDPNANVADSFKALASLEHLTQDQFVYEMGQHESGTVSHLEKEAQLVYVDPDCMVPKGDELGANPVLAKWIRMHSILSLPWWVRRWVIQEAFFSPDPMVTLGINNNCTNTSHNFPGIHLDKFAQLAVWHEAYVSNNPRAHHTTKTLFSNCPFYPLLQLWTPFRTGHLIHQDLPTWLRHTTSFHQTLDRDMVFALVPLSSANDQLMIRTDYKSSDEDLFRRIFAYLVRHPSSPGLLQPFVLSAKPRTFDLPTWCEAYWPANPHLHPTMQFRISSPKPGETESRPFRACGDKLNTVISPSTPIKVDTLFSVQGSPFDEVALIVPTNVTPSSTSDSALRAAIKTCQHHFPTPSTHADPYSDTCGRLMALCMTLIGGDTGDKPANEWWRLFNIWLKGDKHTGMGNANSNPGSSGGGSTRPLPSRRDAGRQTQTFGRALGRRVQKSYRDINPARETLKRDTVDPFFKEARKWGHNRSLVVTKRGYVGLAPLDTEVGDHVAILYGEAVPGILRRSRDSGTGMCGHLGEAYSLVGAAYVHGVMYGEAVEGQGGVNEMQYLLR